MAALRYALTGANASMLFANSPFLASSSVQTHRCGFPALQVYGIQMQLAASNPTSHDQGWCSSGRNAVVQERISVGTQEFLLSNAARGSLGVLAGQSQYNLAIRIIPCKNIAVVGITPERPPILYGELGIFASKNIPSPSIHEILTSN
jgi:hypothetical protein